MYQFVEFVAAPSAPCHLALPFRFETFGAPSSDAGPSQAPSSAGYPFRERKLSTMGKTDSKDRQLGTSHIAKIDLYIVGIKSIFLRTNAIIVR